MESGTSALAAVESAVRARLARSDGRLLVVGVTGAQGSGKTTLAAGLVARLRDDGVRAAALSLDDL
ncbi:MAG: kinase, partial [Proteobacteria bacterium]|nr:kinase [Pseudomonadota bacterium]